MLAAEIACMVAAAVTAIGASVLLVANCRPRPFSYTREVRVQRQHFNRLTAM